MEWGIQMSLDIMKATGPLGNAFKILIKYVFVIIILYLANYQSSVMKKTFSKIVSIIS